MANNKKKQRRSSLRWWGIGYVVVLSMLTLRPFSGNQVAQKEYNLVLFRSIKNYWRHLSVNGVINQWAWSAMLDDPVSAVGNLFTVSFINLLGNVILFIPLGFLLGRLFQRKKGIKTFYSAMAVSAGIELAQFVGLSSRIADVDDVVLNVAGAMVGYVFCLIYDRWKKRK